MDRQNWMYKARRTSNEYLKGVSEFMKVAEENMISRGQEQMLCPCLDCGNNKNQPIDEVRSHLILRGFKENYTNWYWHGEDIVDDEASNVPVSGRNVNENIEILDTNVYENFDDVPNMENFDDVPDNELDELMHDIEGEFADNIPTFFENMNADCKKPLFPNCTKHTKLSAVFKLFKR